MTCCMLLQSFYQSQLTTIFLSNSQVDTGGGGVLVEWEGDGVDDQWD